MMQASAATLTETRPPPACEPIEFRAIRKKIIVPRPDFEAWLLLHDWTWHQLSRAEFPDAYASLEEFQLACICNDPLLWCNAFLREPEDPDHQAPYGFWDYQVDSLRYDGSTVHKCAAEVGKTREIVAWCLFRMFTTRNGSGLIGAPQQTHLDEIIEAMADQFEWNKDLGRSLVRWKKHPHHAMYLSNGFKLYFRPSGFDGEAYRGVHVRTFAVKDEAAKDKNKKQWSEFWRAIKPGCVSRIYSVPDGDRSCDFYKLADRAGRAKSEGDEAEDPESLKNMSGYVKELSFRLFQWPKTLMPAPYWSDERRRFYVEQYGGEDAPEYKHNVLGEDGDPENTVFPWHQFQLCIKEVPEYRALKITVDSGRNEVNVTGYRCAFDAGATGPVPRVTYLADRCLRKTGFFDLADGESDFRRLIKSFFLSVPGLKRAGADFGFAGDPTEIVVKSIVGKVERVVARLYLKHVTYDQQCQALDALDDIYGPMTAISWGTDFGNAGSAVAHDLQGLPQYAHKRFDDRLHGFQFESTSDNIDETGTPIIDAKTGKAAKITLKELATDALVKKMQRQELEYPPDPDIILFYTNHTVRSGGKHRVFRKDDDHLIDADRVQILAQLYNETGEDLFACGN